MVRVYDCNSVTISWGPIAIRSGRAKEEFIRIERVTEAVAVSEVGCDGETSVSKITDKRRKITLTLMQTSVHNTQISEFARAVENTPNSIGARALTVRDLSGQTVLIAAKCWLASPTPVQLGEQAQKRVWTLECVVDQETTGGNNIT